MLDDLTLVRRPSRGLQAVWRTITDADWGYPPIITFGPVWRQTNASRYVRMFQSRRSLLTWKVFGERLDGWANADHPTESVPGDPDTLPPGATANQADLDFTGTIMPPPDSGVAPLTEEQKMTIARWIDLGAPIDTGALEGDPHGWFLDDLRPTLTVSSPRAGTSDGPLGALRFGLADANSGVDVASLSVVADFPVSGRGAGEELADLATDLGDGVYSIPVSPPIDELAVGELTVEVYDHQGNRNRVERRFEIERAILCADIAQARLRCTADGALQAGLRLIDGSHDGGTVTFVVDAVSHTVAISGAQALLSLADQATGDHTVILADPAGCAPAQTVTCP